MQTEADRPQAVELVSRLFWTLVAGGLVVSVLVVVRRHQIADAWTPLHPTDSTIRPVSFVPVVLVLYGFIAVTVLLLVALLRQAQQWSRWALGIVGGGLFLGSFAVMRTAPPLAVQCALSVAAVLSAVALLLLWHPSVRGYLRRSEAADAPDAPDAPDATVQSVVERVDAES
ncbi:MAG TPA: hypothetical protein VN088_13325 [Nocardioides sp.]|nr:hypothetical protein [Nocardioides sp.]